MFAERDVTAYVVTLPTSKPLNPDTNEANVFEVETSIMYEVAPALAVQFTVKPPELSDVVEGEAGTAGESNVKFVALLPVPPVRVTETAPVLPPPVTATICVAVIDVIEDTATPPICTLAAVAPVKPVPSMVMVAPGQPEDGLNEVTVGAGGGVKL